MQTSPLVSIILSVYNTRAYLPQCLDSVLRQTYSHWELLLMDDGSTDGSAAICDSYAADGRVTVVHKQNTGKPDSCNQALSMARGEWVCFVDSDDWLEDNLLEVLMQAVRQTGRDVAIGGHSEEFQDASVVMPVSAKVQSKNRGEAVELFYNRQVYSCFWGKLFRRSLLEESIPNRLEHEDHAVLYRWVSHGNGAVLCPEVLYHYRQRRSSIMGQHGENDMFQLVPIIEECYYFVLQHQLLPAPRNTQIVVRQMVGLAKGIARNGHRGADGTMRKLQLIRECLQRLQPVNKADVDSKTFRRMSLLLKSPARFFLMMRLSGLFVVQKSHHYTSYA